MGVPESVRLGAGLTTLSLLGQHSPRPGGGRPAGRQCNCDGKESIILHFLPTSLPAFTWTQNNCTPFALILLESHVVALPQDMLRQQNLEWAGHCFVVML